ncbi:hypothetical protein FRC04_009637 [Tulasnella sp. 424]|nr:hypothetical protein FRC04_009637 [Tulasnella sp. 424]KAG8975936.1 hypothetical protein FRC05_004867 [Tulasnella sp. 425]
MTGVMVLNAIETARHFYLQPIVACANGIRPSSYPTVAIENGLRCSDAICFEFKLGDLPIPEHPPQVPSSPLPVVVFKAPGTLDARLWTDALGPTISDPGQIEMASIAEHYTGRYVIVSDTLTALTVRHVQTAEGSELHYTPFLDLQENPLRIIIATILDQSLGEGTYFEQTPHMFE